MPVCTFVGGQFLGGQSAIGCCFHLHALSSVEAIDEVLHPDSSYKAFSGQCVLYELKSSCLGCCVHLELVCIVLPLFTQEQSHW